MNIIKRLIAKYKLIGKISSELEEIAQAIEFQQAELQQLNSTNTVYLPDSYAQKCVKINNEIRRLNKEQARLESELSKVAKINILKKSSQSDLGQVQTK